MILKRFYDEKLAHASYLVACAGAGRALVVDPARDIEPYLQAAAEEGVEVTDVTETHIHADFLSGARQLAERTGARLHLSGEGGADWQYGSWASQASARILRDGDLIQVGQVEVKALHTPGHTPEHLSFLLTDRAAGELPVGLFSGDFLFVGDVGRPDLLERAAGWSGTMEPGARRLFQSLARLREYPDSLQIWPAHGAGSACGKSLGGLPTTTLGYERATNWALQVHSEEEFVQEVLRGQPEPPGYFAQMKKLNKIGPKLQAQLPNPPRRSGAVPEGAQVVDVRSLAAYEAGHADGAISLPLGRNFTTWAGSLLRYEQPIVFIAENAAQAQEAARALNSIGLDEVAGWFPPPLAGRAQTRRIGVEEAQQMASATLLDVRGRREWEEGHIPGAVHMPLGDLLQRHHELPREQALVVYCRSSARASVASSVLQRLGFANVMVLQGSVKDWKQPVTP